MSCRDRDDGGRADGARATTRRPRRRPPTASAEPGCRRRRRRPRGCSAATRAASSPSRPEHGDADAVQVGRCHAVSRETSDDVVTARPQDLDRHQGVAAAPDDEHADVHGGDRSAGHPGTFGHRARVPYTRAAGEPKRLAGLGGQSGVVSSTSRRVSSGRIAGPTLDAALRRAFPLIQFVVDAAAWAVAVPVTTFLRYDMRIDPVNEAGVVATVAVAIVLQGLVGLSLGLYRRRYHYGSFDEVRVLGFCVAIVAVVTFVLARLFGGSLVPRSVPVLAAFLALVLAVVCRYVARLVEDRHLRPPDDRSEPIVVFGAGDAGEPDHAHAAAQPEQPIPAGRLGRRRSAAGPHAAQRAARARHRRRRARRRHSPRRPLGAGRHPVDHGRAAPRVRRAAARRRACRCWCCRRSPSSSVRSRPSDIRPVTVADLLGRHPAEVDTAAIAGYITGRRVLVTGAGGSIGAELCRQLQSFEPSTLVMLDRDESGLHATQLELEGRALLDSPSLVLADIRDRERVFQVVPAAPPGGRLPRRRAEAPAAARVQPLRGVEDQRRRHASRAGGGRGRRGRPAREREQRQGRRPGERARVRQAHLRAPHRRGRRPHRPALRLGALRQRARLEGVDARRVRTADPRRRTDHRHPSRREPLLHDVGGGHRADDPGRCHRPSRRGARARHGRAGADRRGRHPPGRAGVVDGVDRLHRAAARARSCTRCSSARERWTSGPPTR